METETTGIEKIGIGKNMPQIEAKIIKVTTWRFEEIEIKEKISKKLVLVCEHPDRDKPIEISSIKYDVKEKLKISGLWVQIDKEGTIRYNSAIAHLLRHANKNAIYQLVGQEFHTVVDDRGYLVIKAY